MQTSEEASQFNFKNECDLDKSHFKLTLGFDKFDFDFSDNVTKELLQENSKFLNIIYNLDYLKEAFWLKQKKKTELKDITKFHQFTAIQAYFQYLEILRNYIKSDPEKNKGLQVLPEKEVQNSVNNCCICLCNLYDEVENYDFEKLLEQLKANNDDDCIQIDGCTHVFHNSCLQQYINKQDHFKCPICFRIYGIMIGDQPEGQMIVQESPSLKCDGFNVGSYVITYSMKSGINPSNGRRFNGTTRVAYIPMTEGGKEVLKLLQLAFERKLIFTIGTSVTTGQQNAVVWNGIHHKTNTHGGASYFGYPDKTYFDRVKNELAAKGIF